METKKGGWASLPTPVESPKTVTVWKKSNMLSYAIHVPFEEYDKQIKKNPNHYSGTIVEDPRKDNMEDFPNLA